MRWIWLGALEQLVDLGVAVPLLERQRRCLQAAGPMRSMHLAVAHIATSPHLSLLIEPWPPSSGRPLRPIQEARCTSRRAASISVATSAIAWWMPGLSSAGLPSIVWLGEVLERELVGGAGDADRAGADERARQLEGRQRVGAAGLLAAAGVLELLVQLVHAAEQVLDRDAAVLEHDLGGLRSADSELVFLLALARGPACPSGR